MISRIVANFMKSKYKGYPRKSGRPQLQIKVSAHAVSRSASPAQPRTRIPARGTGGGESQLARIGDVGGTALAVGDLLRLIAASALNHELCVERVGRFPW